MPWMGTFRGICVKLLRIDGNAIDIAPNYVIYDEDDRQSLIKQAMKELSIDAQQIKPRAVSSIVSNAKTSLKHRLILKPLHCIHIYRPNAKIMHATTATKTAGT